MKLTPEQKAFYEYGKARGILKERKELMISMEGEFDAAIYYPEYRELYHIEEAIRDAWKKRAICRTWQGKRYCGNCKYSDYSEWDVPCFECSHANIVESIDWWKPRKEEQDND